MPGITPAGTTRNSIAGTALQGKVRGGQNPISGAHVYLYAVNNTGYAGPGIAASSANASVSLLSAATGNPADGNGNYYVITASDGSFSINGDYTCSSATPTTYLLAVGGNPGSGNNPAATLLAGLGDCTGSGFASTYAVDNEVSTIAAAYALAGIMTDPTHVSTSGSALALTEKKGRALGNLYTQSTGVALAATPAGSGTVPQSEINTLANILAACINSTGPAFTPCATLFSNAMNGSTAPTDTATAAINIAHNPGANIANLFGLQTATSPFQPDLAGAPNDFTIAINFTGGGAFFNPGLIAIDGSGNIWVANNGKNGSGVYNIAELSAGGAAPSGTTGYTGGGLDKPFGIAIDSSGNIWIANKLGNSISEFNSSGTPNPSSPFTGGGLSAPFGTAIDQSGNLWIANNNTGSISEFNSSGGAISGSSGIAAGGLNDPLDIGIDVSGNVWVTNDNADSISEFNSSGVANINSPFTGGGVNFPGGIAIDGSGNVWTGNSTNSISEFNSAGAAISGSSGYTGGGLSTPKGVAVDGAGNVWVVNNSGNSISEFTSSGVAITGASGYTGGLLNAPNLPAIDGAGNLWVANGADGADSITEFVGVASPVVTPIVANLLAPYGAHAVNKP